MYQQQLGNQRFSKNDFYACNEYISCGSGHCCVSTCVRIHATEESKRTTGSALQDKSCIVPFHRLFSSSLSFQARVPASHEPFPTTQSADLRMMIITQAYLKADYTIECDQSYSRKKTVAYVSLSYIFLFPA